MARGGRGPSTSERPTERSQSDARSQESENESGLEVDVTPDEISIDAGAFEIGIDTEGEVTVGIEIPTPVPGVTATGGIVIDTKTGEIVEVSLGAEFGQVTGFDVALSGCNVTTTFYVEIPNTNIRFSYSILSELPNCKEPEPPPEEPPPSDNPLLPPNDEKMNLLLDWLDEWRKNMPDWCVTELIFAGHRLLSDNPPPYWRDDATNENIWPTKGSGRGPSEGSPANSTFGAVQGYDGPSSPVWGYYEWRARSVLIVVGSDFVRIKNAKRYPTIKEALKSVDNFFYRYGLVFVNSGCNYYPEVPVLIAPSPPSLPKPPEKMDKCCRESLVLLDEIHKALGCSELLDKKTKTGGFEVPRRLLAPGGKGELKHHDYLGIFESVIRIQDNLGFHPFQVNIKDTNAAAAGDQSVNLKFVSLSAALEKILYLLIDTEDDGDAHTNMLVRLAFTCVNILTTLATTSRDVETIRDGLGIGIKAKREFIDTAFDVTCGQNEQGGFDKKKKEEIDKNMEESTEAMLPYLLRIKRHAIKTTEFDDKDDIRDLLIKILYSLKGNS